MNVKLLKTANELAKETLIKAITDYVMENGENMSDYYYNEFGMEEEDEDGVKIVKVLDTSDPGCTFARQFKTNDDSLDDLSDSDECDEIIDKLEDSFHYATYWAFYIVRNADGSEDLKYYCFYNNGVCYSEDSDPDHGYVCNLTLEDLSCIVDNLITYDCVYEDGILFTNKKIFHDDNEHMYNCICFDGYARCIRSEDEKDTIPQTIYAVYPTLEEILKSKSKCNRILEYRGLTDLTAEDITYGDVMVVYGKIKKSV